MSQLLPKDRLNDLSAVQEHFFKKRLLEYRLQNELHLLGSVSCCDLFGAPFVSSHKPYEGSYEFPLLRFFFDHYICNFPLISHLSPDAKKRLWQLRIQKFVEQFNSNSISTSDERADSKTKRKQINNKLLSSLLLFFNSVLITEKDMDYLTSQHIKPGDIKVVSKLKENSKSVVDTLHRKNPASSDITENFINGFYFDVVCVTQDTSDTQSHGTRLFKLPFARSKSDVSYSGEATESSFKYVVKVTRTQRRSGRTEVDSYYLRKTYDEFVAFDSQLRSAYPGLIHNMVKLPKPMKHDVGISVPCIISTGTGEVLTDSSGLRRFDTATNFISERCSPNRISSTYILVRERLRVSLRFYLHRLLQSPDILKTNQFLAFIGISRAVSFSLSPKEFEDVELRHNHEIKILETHVRFQKEVSSTLIRLNVSFNDFKYKLISDPSLLSRVYSEAGKSQSIQQLSPLLKDFIEWCKLQVSSTIYQLFIAGDNSKDWFDKVSKFHHRFPYALVYGILKFTNPLKMMTRLLDLLFVNIPTFSLPKMPFRNPKSPKNHKGSRNLLSMIFIMLLDEDLNDFTKEIKSLKDELIQLDPKFDSFMMKLDEYVSHKSVITRDYIRDKSKQEGKDLLLCILESDTIEPKKENLDRYLFKLLKDSYSSHQSSEYEKSNSKCYIILKQYLQLKTRQRDKIIMKSLWEEKEISQLLKEFLIVFYQPIVGILSKSGVDIAFKAFQNFMNDLIKTIEEINSSKVYSMSSFMIFVEIKSIIDRHQDEFWLFFNSIYSHDTEKVFLRLIEWIEKFLKALRLKFDDPSSVMIDLNDVIPPDTDITNLSHSLQEYTSLVLRKRELINSYFTETTSGSPSKATDKVEQDWNSLGDNLFDGWDPKEMGIDEDEMSYINLQTILDRVERHDDRDRFFFASLKNLDEQILLRSHDLTRYDNRFRTYLNQKLRVTSIQTL